MAKLTKNKILTAIKDSAGILTTVAERLGVARVSLYEWMERNKDQDVVDAFHHEKEKIMDLAESKIVQSIKERDGKTIRWYAMTRGKDRGYTTKKEIEVTGDFKGNISNVNLPLSKEEREKLLEFLNDRRDTKSNN